MSILVENQNKNYGWNPHTTDWVAGGNDTATLVPLAKDVVDITARNNILSLGYALVRGQNGGNLNFLIEGNKLDNVAHLVITTGSNGVIKGNTVTNARNAIQLDGPAKNWEIRGNKISKSREDSPGLYNPSYPQGDGIICNEGTSDVSIYDNELNDNLDCGIDCKASNFYAENNVCIGNKIGNKWWKNGTAKNGLCAKSKKQANGFDGRGVLIEPGADVIMGNYTIVDSDEVDLCVYGNGKLTISRSIIGPKLRGVVGNPNVLLIDCWRMDLQGDPGFVDAANGNYRLKSDAPCNKLWGYQYADVTVPIPPVTPPVATLKGINIVSGYYRVIVGGIEVSKHSEYDQAIESAVNQLLANNKAVVAFKFDGGKVEVK